MARRQNEPFDEEVLRMIASRMNSVPALEDSAMGVAADSEASDAERPAPESLAAGPGNPPMPKSSSHRWSYSAARPSMSANRCGTLFRPSSGIWDLRENCPSADMWKTYCDIIWRSTGRRSIRAIKPRHGISCYKSHERYSFHVSGPRYGLSLFG